MSPKKTIILMLVIALIPVILSYGGFYYFQKNNVEFNTTNYGTLYSPSFEIDLSQATVVGYSKPNSSKWKLVYLVENAICGEYCKTRISNIAKAQILLNNNQIRVETIVVSNKEFSPNLLRAFNKNNLVVLKITKDNFDYLNQLSINSKGKPINNTVVFMDPLNQAALQFSDDYLDIEKIVKDMKKLLAFSRLG